MSYRFIAREKTRPMTAPDPTPTTLQPSISADAIRPLEMRDLDAIWALQRRVRASLPDPTFLADDPHEFFEAHLSRWGCIGGVEQEGELVAFGVLGLGGRVPVEENFGRLIGLPAERLATVGQPDGVAVLGQWRGRGLQKALLRWRLDRAAAHGCRDILSTCEPRNRISLRNMMSFGMRVVKFDYLFGGLPRLVLHKDLAGDHPVDRDRTQVVPLLPDSLSNAFGRGLVGLELGEGGLLMAPLQN